MGLETELPLKLTLVTYCLDEEGQRAISLSGDLLPSRSDVFARSLATAKHIHSHVPGETRWEGFPVWERAVDVALAPKTSEQAAMVFLLRSAWSGDLHAAEIRSCLDGLFADFVSEQAAGADAETFRGMQGVRLHYVADVRAGTDVLAAGVSGVYKITVHRQAGEASHGIRFVTAHDPEGLRAHVHTELYGRKWLRPAMFNGKCVERILPVRVAELPPASLQVPHTCLRTVRFSSTSSFYGNLVTYWVAKPPSGPVLHGHSLESFKSMCAAAEQGGAWSGLIDVLHKHPVGPGYRLQSYGQHVTVASTKQGWKMAQVRVGEAPQLPYVAGVVAMKVRRHREIKDADHTWMFGKVTTLASVHHLCFHAQHGDGKVETRCMVSPRALVALASPAPANAECVEDFGGVLQVFRGGADSDVLWHVKAFVPEQSGVVAFAAAE